MDLVYQNINPCVVHRVNVTCTLFHGISPLQRPWPSGQCDPGQYSMAFLHYRGSGLRGQCDPGQYSLVFLHCSGPGLRGQCDPGQYSMVFLHCSGPGLRGQCDPCVIPWYFSTLSFGVNVTPASIQWYFSTAAALAFGVNVTRALFDGIFPLQRPWPLGSM